MARQFQLGTFQGWKHLESVYQQQPEGFLPVPTPVPSGQMVTSSYLAIA
jgi:hypothetical protein